MKYGFFKKILNSNLTTLNSYYSQIWIFEIYISPIDPAVNPITTKKENSAKSLGKELTISSSWVIWPCAPQV